MTNSEELYKTNEKLLDMFLNGETENIKNFYKENKRLHKKYSDIYDTKYRPYVVAFNKAADLHFNEIEETKKKRDNPNVRNVLLAISTVIFYFTVFAVCNYFIFGISIPLLVVYMPLLCFLVNISFLMYFEGDFIKHKYKFPKININFDKQATHCLNESSKYLEAYTLAYVYYKAVTNKE